MTTASAGRALLGLAARRRAASSARETARSFGALTPASVSALEPVLEEQYFKPWDIHVRQGRPVQLAALYPNLGMRSGGEVNWLDPQWRSSLEFAPNTNVLEVAIEAASELRASIAEAQKAAAQRDKDPSKNAVASAAKLEELKSAWRLVQARLVKLEMTTPDALVVLHCLVQANCFDNRLMERVAERVEVRYFSMDLDMNGAAEKLGLEAPHPASELLGSTQNFQTLVCSLPFAHKVKLVLLDDFRRDSGIVRVRKPQAEQDGRAKWRTIDPVEMEDEERRQFEKGRLRVKRVRHVEAQETRVPVGRRLRAALAFQLKQELSGDCAASLAKLSQVFAFPEARLLHGDLQDDFQEAFSREVLAIDTHLLLPHLLALCAAMRGFTGPEAYRAWRKKLLPAISKWARTAPEHRLDILERQRAVHPRLFGVPWEEDFSDFFGRKARARLIADRAARLLIAVSSAKQVQLDCELFDMLARPLSETVSSWCREVEGSSALSAPPPVLLPLELIADALNAAMTAGIAHTLLAARLGQLLVVQYSSDISEGVFAQSAYHPADVASAAHGLAFLAKPGTARQPLNLLWEVGRSKLRVTQPHFALMLLNALVRSGPEELLTSKEMLEAADEFLAQRLDLDPSWLGKFCS